MGLPYLESFALRSLVPVGGSQYREPVVIVRWAHGDDVEVAVPHRTLSSISLLQVEVGTSQQSLHRWSKRDPQLWELVSSRLVHSRVTFCV